MDLVVVVTVVMTERVDERVLDVTTERVEVADAVRVSDERQGEHETGDIRVVVGAAVVVGTATAPQVSLILPMDQIVLA